MISNSSVASILEDVINLYSQNNYKLKRGERYFTCYKLSNDKIGERQFTLDVNGNISNINPDITLSNSDINGLKKISDEILKMLHKYK